MGILVVAIISFSIVALINNIRLGNKGNRIIEKPTNDLVREFINILSFTMIENKINSRQKIENVYWCVYRSEEVEKEIKEELYLRLIKKGYRVNNNLERREEINEEKIKQSGEEGERIVAYNLKWIAKEYKILNNIVLKSEIESQEFDNIVIGPNGIFHIETKNYGGEKGCKIIIDKSSNWIREDYSKKVGIESPEFQLKRHQRVIEENISKIYSEDNLKIKGIIVLSNPKTILEGAENSDVPVIKADKLCKYIEQEECDRLIEKNKVEEIYKILNTESSWNYRE